MVKKRGVSKKLIIIFCIGGMMFLPLSVYGSTQPDDIEVDEIEVETVEGLGRIKEVLKQTPTVIQQVQKLYGQISTGDFNSAIEGILGAMGLLNPAQEAARISNSEDENNPYANPETPQEVYELQKHTAIVRSQMPQQLSQIVFSHSGQEAMARESEQLQQIQSASTQAQLGAGLAFGDLERIAQENGTYARDVGVTAGDAQSMRASQDVLKALAEQNEELSQIIAGNSEQLAYLGEIGAYQSLQLSGVNAQLAALNGKGQVLEVLMASQNYLMSQLNSTMTQQQEYQQYKDSLDHALNRNMLQMVFIPGLFPKSEGAGDGN